MIDTLNNKLLNKVAIYDDKISYYTWKVNDETTKVNCMIINCYGFWKVFISKWQSYTIAQFVKAGNICSSNFCDMQHPEQERVRERERGEEREWIKRTRDNESRTSKWIIYYKLQWYLYTRNFVFMLHNIPGKKWFLYLFDNRLTVNLCHEYN